MRVTYSPGGNLVLAIKAEYQYYIFDTKIHLICGPKLVIPGYPPYSRIWYRASF